MKQILLFSAALLATGSAMADSQLDEYQKWRQKELSSFQSYLDENDKAFIGFLKDQWKPVDVKPAEVHDPKPKPVELPKAPAKQPPLADKPAVVISDSKPPVKVKPKPKPAAETTKPSATKPAPSKPDTTKPGSSVRPALKPRPEPQPSVAGTELKSKRVHTASFNFYGNPVSIEYPKNFKRIFTGKINNEKIADYWKYLASKEHQPTINQLKATARQLKLNDWGTALLFDRFSGSFLRQQTSRQLTTWFLLVKAGYDARVAYNNNLFLLLPSKQELFGVTFFTLNKKRYYAVNLNGKPMKPGKVFTYSGQHGAGAGALDFSQPNNFAARGKVAKRTLSFSYADKKYDIRIDYPTRYVDYFNSFPQLSLPNYFQAGLPAVTAESLLSQLKPVVAGQTEQEAVNRLLRFVQTSFQYQTDDQQFKEENYLFPLETLHYPYSDCEDRAALFAWLTENLLDLEVIILDYPGHVATAVNFSDRVKGDAWQYQGKRYVVADPTYINAVAGMTMPQFAGKAPKVQPF